MAISDNYIPLKELGNGSTKQFSANWAVLNAEFLRVFLEDVVTGDQVPQTDGLDYSVEFDRSSFVVTFLVAPTSDNFVVIAREVPLDQIVIYKTADGFQGVKHENSLDKLTAIDQDQTDAIRRALKFPLGSTSVGLLPKPIDGHGVIWDGDTGTMRNTADPLGDFEDDVKIVADNIDNINEVADNIEDVAGITWLGPWLPTKTYEINDAIEDAGTSFICTRAHLNQQPPDLVFWDVMAEKGDQGAGTVNSVDTGAGLKGGPIVDTGTISVDIAGTPSGVLAAGDEFLARDVSTGLLIRSPIQSILDLPTAGGDYVNILKRTASADTFLRIDTNINSTFSTYRLRFWGLKPSVNAIFRLRVSSDGGLNYDAGGSDYLKVLSPVGGNSTFNSIELADFAVTPFAGGDPYLDGEIVFSNPDDSTRPPLFRFDVFYQAPAGLFPEFRSDSGAAVRINNQLTNAIEISVSTGTFDGEFALDGIK